MEQSDINETTVTVPGFKALLRAEMSVDIIKAYYAALIERPTTTIQELREIEPLFDAKVEELEKEQREGVITDGTERFRPLAAIYGESFNELDLRRRDLSNIELVNCELTGCDLSRTTITDAIIIGSKLIDCNLNGATLCDTSFINCVIRDCKITDTHMMGTLIFKSFLNDCDFTDTDFERAQIMRTTIKACNFPGTGIQAPDENFFNINCWIL